MSEEQEKRATAPSPPSPAGEGRFPLAFDLNGDPIELPPNAIAWRVRRGGGRRGRPSHVFDSETGRQLEIPLGATIEALIEAGCPPDRYLLYPVDGAGHIIPGIIAVTSVPELPGDEEAKASEEVALASRSDPIAQLAIQQHATIQRVCEYLCRGFEAAASGYGPIRPVQKPTPTVRTRAQTSCSSSRPNASRLTSLPAPVLGSHPSRMLPSGPRRRLAIRAPRPRSLINLFVHGS